MIKNKKGFTLVELLAVIVILAIILVIAVPKVMSVIEDSKKATLESTAKMIASTAEKQKVQNTVLGKETQITCDSVAKINKLDYEDCDIEFDDNTAKVTIKGSGKFEGLNVCEGTKTEAQATEEGCEKTCLIDYDEKVYTVKDYDSCVSYLTNVYSADGYDSDYITDSVPAICSGNGYDEYETQEWFEIDIDNQEYTVEDLIENNVIDETITKKICITEETPASCFEYEKRKNYIIKDYDNCVNYLTAKDVGFDKENFCSGKSQYKGQSFETFIEGHISHHGYISKQDLIDNNIIEIQEVDEYTVTNYDTSCGIENVVIPSLINGVNVTAIDVNGFYNEQDEDGNNISYTFDRLKIPSTVNLIKYYGCGGINIKKYVYLGNPNTIVDVSSFSEINDKHIHNLPDSYDYGCDG